jgi:hypothetical protein
MIEAYDEVMPERDMDEPVNVGMEPEDALRVLLGEERRDDETCGKDNDENEPDEADTG